MFLGRNRFLNQGGVTGDGGSLGVGDNTELFNQNSNQSTGMQRFLAKKGINSPSDLANRVQFAPRMPFRKVR